MRNSTSQASELQNSWRPSSGVATRHRVTAQQTWCSISTAWLVVQQASIKEIQEGAPATIKLLNKLKVVTSIELCRCPVFPSCAFLRSLSDTFPDAPCRKTSSTPLVDDSLVLRQMRAMALIDLQPWTTRKHAKALHTACALATLSKGCCRLLQTHLTH